MFKKIATGLLAIAATSAVALSLPGAANADTFNDDDYSEYWGPVYSKHHLAKADGVINVDWDDDGESNEVRVKGRLFDLDKRTYSKGGKCAYVKFEASDFDHDWSPVYNRKYCGFPGYKAFSFKEHDVYSLRVKVCQVGQYSNYPQKCGSWEYLYTAEGE
ncbi:hypothetical protein [Nonomuraea jiangxiensis]|uniref:Uncharacterized protein n=1 Tax=Nonomuraea jiangxiensis TaxID=633440 RepID=A0A1G8XM59_9ACTN|nr:hypothetical protein [Nonomuraea jiangxiensis]SDJ91699.1 hypothetical protein SAMN05421869_11314 [Nonomuraea jiangxiensis]